MSIMRAPRPETKFYILDKSISEDPRLGWAARGLLIYLLGKPDHWEVSITDLVNQTANAGKPSKRDAVYAALKEIEEAGYLHKCPKRSEGGSFAGTEYVVTEAPGPLPDNPDTVTPPHTDYPHTGEPDTVNPIQVSNEGEVRTEEEASNQQREAFEESFDIFWTAGLTKKRKQDARKAWRRLVKDRADPTGFARELAEDIQLRIRYQQLGIDKLHPATYLNGRRWEDELADERWLPGGQTQKKPGSSNSPGDSNNRKNDRNDSDKRTDSRSISDGTLRDKDYSSGATGDESLPDYLRQSTG